MTFICNFFNRKIDENKQKYIDALKEAIAIQSVSAWPKSRPEIRKMLEWAQTRLQALGATVELKDIGMQTFPDGTEIPLPPVLIGKKYRNTVYFKGIRGIF